MFGYLIGIVVLMFGINWDNSHLIQVSGFIFLAGGIESVGWTILTAIKSKYENDSMTEKFEIFMKYGMGGKKNSEEEQ